MGADREANLKPAASDAAADTRLRVGPATPLRRVPTVHAVFAAQGVGWPPVRGHGLISVGDDVMAPLTNPVVCLLVCRAGCIAVLLSNDAHHSPFVFCVVF